MNFNNFSISTEYNINIYLSYSIAYIIVKNKYRNTQGEGYPANRGRARGRNSSLIGEYRRFISCGFAKQGQPRYGNKH